MNIVSCNDDVHTWVCKISKGALNEIITYKNINNIDLERIRNGDKSLCSPENIECKNCGILLNNNSQKNPVATLIQQYKDIKFAE